MPNLPTGMRSDSSRMIVSIAWGRDAGSAVPGADEAAGSYLQPPPGWPWEETTKAPGWMKAGEGEEGKSGDQLESDRMRMRAPTPLSP